MKMKAHRICVAAMVTLAGAVFAHADEIDPADKIVMHCRAGWTPYIADVAYAVARSGYWATQGARREMLTLTRQARASGSTKIAFAPPADRRQGPVAENR